MSIRLFAGYFFVLSTCSTIAFASCLMGRPAPQQTVESPVIQRPLPTQGKRALPLFQHHPPAPKATLVACAQ